MKKEWICCIPVCSAQRGPQNAHGNMSGALGRGWGLTEQQREL